MDFADDLPNDDDEERFRKHNRFLRTLKEDTLLIIDNFNVTATQDGLLSVVMKYRCRVLFTTCSRFNNYISMTLEEIIHTVHSHTLAVEMSARLLETGIMEPMLLLNKLKEEKAGLDATDTIGITKDGKSQKATYYHHIHTLFFLYRLSDAETNIMRSISLLPVTGISGRLFAN